MKRIIGVALFIPLFVLLMLECKTGSKSSSPSASSQKSSATLANQVAAASAAAAAGPDCTGSSASTNTDICTAINSLSDPSTAQATLNDLPNPVPTGSDTSTDSGTTVGGVLSGIIPSSVPTGTSSTVATSSQQSAGLGLIIGGSIVAAGGVAFLGSFVYNLKKYQTWKATRAKQTEDQIVKDLQAALDVSTLQFGAKFFVNPISSVIDTAGAIADIDGTTDDVIKAQKLGMLIDYLGDSTTFDPRSASYAQLDTLQDMLAASTGGIDPSIKNVWKGKIQQIGVNRTDAEIAIIRNTTVEPKHSMLISDLLLKLLDTQNPKPFDKSQMGEIQAELAKIKVTSSNPLINKDTLRSNLANLTASAPPAKPTSVTPELPNAVKNPIPTSGKSNAKMAVASGIIGALLGAAGAAMIGVGAAEQNGSLGLADGTCASSATLACYINNVGAIALQASKP